MRRDYLNIVKHYEDCFLKHGDSHLGVDWPNEKDAITRYEIMLDIIPKDKEYSLLDFGCGAGHMLEYIRKKNIDNIVYTGLELSQKFIDHCINKFNNIDFLYLDILNTEKKLPSYDFIILNGVFTEKQGLDYNSMFDYFKKLLTKLFEITNCGLAFNVMSKHVDWERDDLFHLPHDALAEFLTKNLSRNYIIRNDYKLYEYTTYLYK